MISVIMPVFNEEKHLEECMNSILGQSFQDWELHAVDDFSTDTSFAILSEYAKSDKRIHVHSNTEKGIISALNLAYSKSSFPFVTRMDADDKMAHEKLEKLMKTSVVNPHACVTGLVEYFSDGTLADGFLRYADWLNGMTANESHFHEIYKECVVASPCWMIRRETIEKIGGICSGRYPEDYDLIFRLYEHNVQIIGVPQVLHYWRDHAGRASRNDPNYADQGFIELKMHYLTKLEIPKKQSVILWGAGRAGKLWAKALKGRAIEFSWITDNEKKIGKDIYGVKIESLEKVQDITNALFLIAIKSPAFLTENEAILEKLKVESEVLMLY